MPRRPGRAGQVVDPSVRNRPRAWLAWALLALVALVVFFLTRWSAPR
ncbi:MAG TPA: hypothetical protein VLH79_13350 [Chthonomonadales bacterium]|nr:hypothetical protein [Chthonomonadales bacterium]